MKEDMVVDYGEHVKITCYLIYFHSEKSSDALMLYYIFHYRGKQLV